MQTRFTPEQLQDPHMAAAEKILRSCVHCGLCTATCPTYLLLGDELDSPRGRIYLIKDMLENARPADEKTVKHIDRCLTCLSCMSTCPSGVDYMHLVDHARIHIEQTYKRPWRQKFIRQLLAHVLPYPRRFRAALAASFFAKPFAGLLARLGGPFKPLSAMLKLAPARFPPRSRFSLGAVIPAQSHAKGRVALLTGCAQTVLQPDINEAAVALLTRSGFEVVLAKGEGCCGALVHHMGQAARAHTQAKANIDAWWREIEASGLDAIVITASGCGTTIKDYGHMLRHDPLYAENAARISALAKDISEVLLNIDFKEPERQAGHDLRVAYHAACSMQHGQGLKTQPKQLLKRAGFHVVDIPEGHICCGSAGVYNILQADIANQLQERKAAFIKKTKADILATGNIGCITQLSGVIGIPAVHTVQLLNWAYGGKPPAGLESLLLD